MLSLKVCFVLSDLSVPGRGATKIIPGSHRNNTLARTEDLRDPAGAMEIVAGPGDAFIFDRRMWHARSVNLSNVTRKLIFVGYTHRWIRPLDALPASTDLPWWNELSPVCQQLLGAGEDQSSFWGIRPDGWLDDQIPLRAELLERGLLDRTTCYLR
jgi:ectoine hydroxylase-related dioxygenase (phytanoyl-CoA dioxygenase family)